MFEHRSLKLPIILGVTMIVLIVVLIVGWVLLTVFSALRESENAPLYYTFLLIGILVLASVLVGVVIYLALTIKSINLNRRQANFIDAVTHELKSPIASLKLYLQTLSRHQVSQAEQSDFHRFMLEDVARLDDLIDQLLATGRLDRPTSEVDVEDVELAELLEQCAAEIAQRYQLAEDAIELDVVSSPVRAIRVDLQIVFRNLIDNAVKYAGESPRVQVQLRPAANDQVLVSITDNGPGIPLAARRKIFRRFVRLGPELERKRPGTGLGLYLVRTVVKRMGGHVRIRDPEAQTGTVFEVELPRRYALADRPPQPHPEKTELQTG